MGLALISAPNMGLACISAAPIMGLAFISARTIDLAYISAYHNKSIVYFSP